MYVLPLFVFRRVVVSSPKLIFMENYDLSRKGYHDSRENIDLDYGAALAAIAIESVARARPQLQRHEGSLASAASSLEICLLPFMLLFINPFARLMLHAI